jgi:hypothetical protein
MDLCCANTVDQKNKSIIRDMIEVSLVLFFVLLHLQLLEFP